MSKVIKFLFKLYLLQIPFSYSSLGNDYKYKDKQSLAEY